MLGPERFVRYAVLAGDQALAAHAYEEAETHFRSAIDARGTNHNNSLTAAALLGLGRAQAQTDEGFDQSTTTLARAFEWYAGAGDIDGVINVVLSLPYQENEQIGGRDLVTRALALVAPESLVAGRLFAIEAMYRGLFDADYPGAVEDFTRANAIANSGSDRSLELRVHNQWALVDQYHLRWHDSLARSEAAITLGRALGDEPGEMAAHVLALRALCALGEPDRAAKHGSAGVALAERIRVPVWLNVAESLTGNIALMTGDWYRARGLIKSPGFPLAMTTTLECQVGNFEAASRLLDEFLEMCLKDPPTFRMQRSLLVMVAGLAEWVSQLPGQFDAVEPILTDLVADAQTPYAALLARAGEAMAVVTRRDTVAAKRLYEAIAPGAGSGAFLLPVAVDHLLGMLAVTMGHNEIAGRHFDAALAFCSHAGYRPAYGWAAADYAALLLDRGNAADRARAIALGNEALAIGRELGMRPLVERVLARREFLKA